MFNDIIHNLVQNIATAFYAIRNCRCRPTAESRETDDRQREEDFWNSSVGREISARIEAELHEHCSR